MSIFAGVITNGKHRVPAGKAESMLSHIAAPRHKILENYNDESANIAVRTRKAGTDFYSGHGLLVVSDCRFNGAEQLCRELELQESEFNNAHLLALAYRKWGEELVSKLSGEFAFAIWNKKENALFCGRDKFGRVPIAYLITSTGIEFASDFQSVAADQSSPLPVNEEWIIEYSMGVVVDKASTPFVGLMRLPPGCVLKWHRSKLEINQYWSFQEIERSTEDASIAGVLSAVEDSIEDRILGPDLVTLLSGGLDSSSISILARDEYQLQFGEPIHAVSLDTGKHSENSDKPFIDLVIDQGGFIPHVEPIKEYCAVSEIQRLVSIEGAPVISSGGGVFDQALNRIQRLGFFRVLDGHGGDEVISSFGVMRLFELARARKWISLLVELVRVSKNSDLPVLKNFAGLYSTRGSGIGAAVFRRVYSLLNTPIKATNETSMLRRDLETHPAFARSVATVKDTNPSLYKTERDYQESVLNAPLQSQAHETLYRQYRSHGLRPEFPFWDERVVEQCLKTPSQEKLKKGVPRSLIRSVMGSRLPQPVSTRITKFDFSGYLVRSLQANVAELQLIAQNRTHSVFDFIDNDAFAMAIENLQSDQHQKNIDAAKRLWPALNIFCWLNLITSYSANQNNLEPPC